MKKKIKFDRSELLVIYTALVSEMNRGAYTKDTLEKFESAREKTYLIFSGKARLK